MFGFIHDTIRVMVLRKYDEETWNKILDRAGFESGKENVVNHYYGDSSTYAIVDAISAIAKIPQEAIWEAYGEFIVGYLLEVGWDELLKTMSPTLLGFIENLDALHYFIDHVVYKTNLRGPNFRCERNPDGTITLHYFTGRSGLYPIVQGILRTVAKGLYGIDITISLTDRTQRHIQMASGDKFEEHVTFLIKQVGGQKVDVLSVPMERPVTPTNEQIQQLCLNQQDFALACPYHFMIDKDDKLVQWGKELYNHVSNDLLVTGTPVSRLFDVLRPHIPLDFENVKNFINAVFVLQVRTAPTELRRSNPDYEAKLKASSDSVNVAHLKVKGQFILMEHGERLLFLCSPYFTNIDELEQHGMKLSHLPIHDATRDLILLNQSRLEDVQLSLDLEKHTDDLERISHELEEEKKRSDELLMELLTPQLANVLISGMEIEPKLCEKTTVMFCDLPNFQLVMAKCQPAVVVQVLADLFAKFDRLVLIHQVLKVETVGDSYICAGGVPEETNEHAENVCHVALGMMFEARTILDPLKQEPLMLRCGIHSGPVVTGVVATKVP
ncbi:Protein GCY-36, partial [Aphelenchoides avenae]